MTLRANPFKPKKCAQCRCEFTPQRPMQRVCGIECAKTLARKKREKVERAADRQKRESLKTLTEYADDAQKVFNAVRRHEDLAAGYGCMSCDTHNPVRWQAGHYMNVKTHKALRFNPVNVNLQCSQCNCDEGGNKIEYRKRMVVRYGVEAVEALECDQEIKRHTVEELKAIKAENVAKLKELRK